MFILVTILAIGAMGGLAAGRSMKPDLAKVPVETETFQAFCAKEYGAMPIRRIDGVVRVGVVDADGRVESKSFYPVSSFDFEFGDEWVVFDYDTASCLANAAYRFRRCYPDLYKRICLFDRDWGGEPGPFSTHDAME